MVAENNIQVKFKDDFRSLLKYTVNPSAPVTYSPHRGASRDSKREKGAPRDSKGPKGTRRDPKRQKGAPRDRKGSKGTRRDPKRQKGAPRVPKVPTHPAMTHTRGTRRDPPPRAMPATTLVNYSDCTFGDWRGLQGEDPGEGHCLRDHRPG